MCSFTVPVRTAAKKPAGQSALTLGKRLASPTKLVSGKSKLKPIGRLKRSAPQPSHRKRYVDTTQYEC